MGFEKSIIKAHVAKAATFDYKARELHTEITPMARSFVDEDHMRSPDFKISELVAQQVGISQLESDALQDQINAQVLERLKEVQEKAYREGYDLGIEEGTAKAFEESKAALTEKLMLMDQQLERMQVLKTNLLIDNEAELIKLVYTVAKKMALRDLEENREAVWELLKDVIGELQSEERLVVRVCTADQEFLNELRAKTERSESFERVKFVVDDNIRAGGCFIESQYGTVNATIEERVERTWATLATRIPRQKHEPKD